MSAWGKILAPITVETGGWNFGFREGAAFRTVTIPAATYDTILELLDALRVVLDVLYTPVITCSSTGTVAITIAEMTAHWWAGTDAHFEELGFAMTEGVVGTTLTASSTHDWGYYPGTLSYGASRGTGLAADGLWLARDVGDGVVSGAGQRSQMGPVRAPYERQLLFGPVLRVEARDQTRGAICLLARWRFLALRWYPDRDLGTVAALGSQGDPGSPYWDDDADCEYWEVTIVGTPLLVRHTQNANLFTLSLQLNAEPIL